MKKPMFDLPLIITTGIVLVIGALWYVVAVSR